MAKHDLLLATYFFIGFIAFSIPLLAHDAGIWSAAGGGDAQDYAASMPPAPPPPYYGSYHEPDDDATKFRHAVAEGDIPTAEQLLNASLAADEPVDFVTTPHWHGSTALFEAARSGHLAMAKWLVARGADPDHANEWGDSPANEAASMGHWDLVWYLADSGANLTRTTEHSHSTLLLSAVRHRSTAALAELKRRGVDLTQRQWNGATAIHEAARTGETDVVDWLVSSSGIDVNATNDQGESAVHEAAMMGHNDAMWHLIRAGGDTGAAGSAQAASLVHSAVTHANMELLELLRSRGTLSLESDKHGRVPIIEAVRMGDKGVITWLISHGANVSATSSSDETPIAVAAMEDRFEIVWLLAEAGASLKTVNEYGGTPLLSAVHHGRADDVTKLLEKGLDVNAANHRGDTTLTLAAAKGDVKLVELLLEKGASAAPQGARMDTPLIRAARFRRGEVLKLLLESNGERIKPPMEVNGQNKRGDTALLEACRAGSVEAATLLLQHGAELGVKNNMGMTPLLEAAEAGSLELAKLLVSHVEARGTRGEALGEAFSAKNSHGQGLLELSKWTSQSEELSAYFKSHGAKEVEEEHH